MALSAKTVPIDREIARQAAAWILRLQAADVTEQDHQNCAHWRRQHAEHERAWQLANRFSEQLQSIPPAVGRSTLYRSANLKRRLALKSLTTMIVVGSLGFAASRSPAVVSLVADISTGVGERRTVSLSDGTLVQLNTDSAIDVRYTPAERMLVLRKGEIFVTTGRADGRPFSVESGLGNYRPIGTKFSVRQLADHDLLQVLEGQVAVVPHQAPGVRLDVAAGQQARVTTRTVQALPEPVRGIDWLDGVLRVERMPLADFVAELGRYRRGWTRCEPQVAGLLISGAFQLQDTDSVLAAVALTLPVKVSYVTRYWVTLGPLQKS
ncbi:FecR domain-containing protein [Pseudomonas sp. LJDD11]|uniref:FecR domain-containing protein n=1 Tax=Pseudomonas sp. LJDD11 TaxID=2931984 RepID=UPI0004F5A7A5|nr:FecR domain-containing protein [Pseudomonas sp. LJDD11]MCQ9424208.1 FecR domain-containing protein [Pseudomonas sp. LJDD11]BAP43459.1 anti-FecI sigma factor FecR [Pseudomonas sp. StFLB209]